MKRLFVRLPNWVGDVVMATPALRALRAAFPEARIAWGCRPYVLDLLGGLPWKDEILLEEGSRLGFVRRLRAGGFDAALLLSSSFGSAAGAWAAGIPRRAGLDAHGRGLLLTDRLPRERDREGRAVPVYMGDLYLKLAALLGAASSDRRLELAVTPADEEEAEALWRECGFGVRKVVGLVPGAAYGSSKCWPPGRFAALAGGIRAATGTKALLLYGPGEEGIAGEILRGVPDAVFPAGPDRVGLGGLKAVMRRLSAAVTNDSGPRHIAEAFSVPVVVLLGPMDPRYTHSGNPCVTELTEHVDCAPCNLRVCPVDHRCLERIQPERVLEALRGVLA